MARPKKPVNEELLVGLARIHCTMNEMSAILKVSVDTLERRFADVIKKAQEEGKSSLRRQMFKMALDGDRTMCIWLSKQYLGMSEKVEQTNPYEDRRLEYEMRKEKSKLDSMDREELHRYLNEQLSKK